MEDEVETLRGATGCQSSSSFFASKYDNQPGPSETLKSLYNWHELFSQIIDTCEIDAVAKDWILTNFYSWDTFDFLNQCEDLTPRNIQRLEKALKVKFLDFVAQRQAFIRYNGIWGVTIKINSPLIRQFSKGAEVLRNFVNSDEIFQHFPPKNCDQIRTALRSFVPSYSKSNKMESNNLTEVEKIMKNENFKNHAIAEVLDKITEFEDLRIALESCEELTKRQIELLTVKLKDVFMKLKISSYSDPRLKLIESRLEVLSLPVEAVDWIMNWLQSQQKPEQTLNLDGLELCEDLSKRKCKAVIEALKEVYKLDDAQQTDPKPACEIFLERVDTVLKNRPDIIESARTWILENICSFRSMHDLEVNKDLSKKQMVYLKTELITDFEEFRAHEPGPIGIDREFLVDAESEFFDAVSASEDETSQDSMYEDALEKLEGGNLISIILLISHSKINQDGFAVGKFSLSEKVVEQLSMMVPGVKGGDDPVIYRSLSHGLIVDFDLLNKLEIKCVGLFGPSNAVLQALSSEFPQEVIQNFKERFEKLSAGLYLVDFEFSQRKYVIFHGEAEDFVNIKKDSRAVHFLRYMSQLVEHVIFCVDETNQELLAAKTTDVSKTTRGRKYQLNKYERQQESCKMFHLGFLESKIDFRFLFASSAGLVGITCEQIDGAEKLKTKFEKINVQEANFFIMSSEILDLNKICNEFKSQFIKLHHEEIYNSLKENAENCVQSLRSLSYEYIQLVVLNSVALYFICTQMNRIFEAVQLYYVFNSHKTVVSWEEVLKFDQLSITEILSEENITTVVTGLSCNEHFEHLIDKYFLWAAASHRNGIPAWLKSKGLEQATWEEVNEVAKNAYRNAWEGRTENNFQRAMQNAIKNHDYQNIDQFFQQSMNKFLDNIRELIFPFTEESLFVAYCQKVQREQTDKERTKELTKFAANKFDEIIQNSQPTLENSLKPQRKIKSIYKNSGDPDFCVLSEEILRESPKKSLKFYKLTTTKQELRRVLAGGEDINIRNIEFTKSGVLETEINADIHAAYSIEESKTLVIFNKETRSDCTVFNDSQMKTPLINLPIGKVVSESSFDCTSRTLALHSNMDFGIVHLFRFSDKLSTYQKLTELNLSEKYGLTTNFSFCIQNSCNFFWFFCDDRARQIDLKKSYKLTKVVPLNTEESNAAIQSTPGGGCLLVVTNKGQTFPIMTATGNVLDPMEQVSIDVKIVKLCNQTLAIQQDEKGKVKVDRITVTGSQHETKLEKIEMKETNQDDTVKANKDCLHWINYLKWMYTKFPCDDLLSIKNRNSSFWLFSLSQSTKFKENLKKETASIYQKLQLTQKPINTLIINTENLLNSLSYIQSISINGLQLGEIVRKLITFVPIQIARCQANAFQILDNGQPILLDNVNFAFDLIDKIYFGLYESIFNAWNGDIKVISSMGKQSTGKSYTLNHLTGSSFNIAGTRCTDGCWMTVKEQEDCLYVILDFEGLGSFERTEQEDMLLSLFNSSISTLTIFKTEKQLDRGVDKIFNKINAGSDQLKGNEQMFRGQFVIVINDVAEHDVDDVPIEFEEKISAIVTINENNFIKKLFNGNFEIKTFPTFESKDYYESLSVWMSDIRNELQSVFKGGPQFLRFLKWLMSKLAVNDFSPLDRQQIDERVTFLTSHLDVAIKTGQIALGTAKRKELDLKCLDDPSICIPVTKTITIASIGEVILDDLSMTLYSTQLSNFVCQFLRNVSDITPINFLVWRKGLQFFVEQSIQLRFERVKMWLEVNLKKWSDVGNSEFDDIVKGVIERHASRELIFQQILKFCEEKCAQCFLKCTQIANHKSHHTCSTAHKCTTICQFCSQEEGKPCKLLFGHDGKHVCSEMNHLCGCPCRFRETNGCVAECQKVVGHKDGHQCSGKHHPCSKTCSLKGCEGRCIISCEEKHSVHKCTKEQCISKCSIALCSNKCAALDHFHGTKFSKKYNKEQKIVNELPFLLEGGKTRFDCTEHFCGKEHQCEEVCSEDGFCQVWTEKQLKDEVFVGARDTFNYSLQFAEKGQKLTCRRKIRPFAKNHEGNHICSTERHFCRAKCPTCENICDKQVNHEQNGDALHHVRHGNMRNCFFVANEDDIQVGSHKYKVGEPAVAEMCHIFCNSMGRGHVHIVKCESSTGQDCYSSGKDGRRHQTTKYHPNPDVPKDEMTHEAYWSMIGFQDPCQPANVEEFLKCPAVCSSEKHLEESEESLCELPLLHSPIKKPSDVNRSGGFVTKDGHLFPCSHPVWFYHFVLCLDDSGSMKGPPWVSLERAVQQFVQQRIQNTQNDYISILNHHHEPWVAAEFIPIGEFSNNLLIFRGGGNNFSAALLVADQLIGNHLDKNVIPVLVFMSDGSCRNGEDEMEEICEKYKLEHKLEIYTLGFGKVRFEKLRELARVGRGEFLKAVNGMQLKAAFADISAKHPATIGVVL